MVSGNLAKNIESAFGSDEAFKKQFADAAAAQFGSGWAWLVVDANTEASENRCDRKRRGAVYYRTSASTDTRRVGACVNYLDYQNRRPDCAKAAVGKPLNWEFATIDWERAGNAFAALAAEAE